MCVHRLPIVARPPVQQAGVGAASQAGKPPGGFKLIDSNDFTSSVQAASRPHCRRVAEKAVLSSESVVGSGVVLWRGCHSQIRELWIKYLPVAVHSPPRWQWAVALGCGSLHRKPLARGAVDMFKLFLNPFPSLVTSPRSGVFCGPRQQHGTPRCRALMPLCGEASSEVAVRHQQQRHIASAMTAIPACGSSRDDWTHSTHVSPVSPVSRTFDVCVTMGASSSKPDIYTKIVTEMRMYIHKIYSL